MFRQTRKPVKSGEEKKKGLLSSLTNIFKKNQKKRNYTTITKNVVTHKPTPERKHNSKTTLAQVRKLFDLIENNPNLTKTDLEKLTGIQHDLINYYKKKGKTQSIKAFKTRTRKQKAKLKKKQSKKKPKPTKTTTKLREQNAGKNLNKLWKEEKYPVEHQSDPRYFSESEPPQSVATEENFKIQKNKNNANRATVAKKIAKDKVEAERSEQEQKVLKRLRERHQNPKTKPKIHYPNCPCCNPHSTTSLDEYQAEVRRESLRRHDYAQKQLKLHDREKELDKREREQEGTVAERTQQGTQICWKCDDPISYSQATRSYNRHGKYYCQTHEPRS